MHPFRKLTVVVVVVVAAAQLSAAPVLAKPG
jgi:hypothetical protein